MKKTIKYLARTKGRPPLSKKEFKKIWDEFLERKRLKEAKC